MAVTIDARPSRIWPWLAQMGVDRAGWYSWDRLDNWGRRSAERIHPEWQQISVGDCLAAKPDGSEWCEVAALEPERFLGLRMSPCTGPCSTITSPSSRRTPTWCVPNDVLG
jgi:proline iminopeptidase